MSPVPEPRILGRKPSPRVLIIASPDEETTAAIARTSATWRSISYEDLATLRQREWDIAVVFRGIAHGTLESHLHVMIIGGADLGRIEAKGGRAIAHLVGKTYTTELVISEGPWHPLVERDLVPLAVTRTVNPIAAVQWLATTPTAREPVIEPFLSDPDGGTICGRFRRGEEGAELWFLLDGCDVGAWFRLAIERWSASNPHLRPEMVDWTRDTVWMTPDEIAAVAAITSTEEERDRQLAIAEAQIAQQRATYEAMRSAGDEGIRRLLTAQGDPLVEACISALVDLGFQCEDRDATATPGDKLEDIRVTDTDDPGWIALVEVRGYKRGAQLNDLLRLGRFVSRYAAEAGSQPGSTWYVVNSFMESPPDGRDVPLASNPEEVAEFAVGGGLVVDTCDLFRLWRSVQSGERTAGEARRALKGTGRLEIDPTDPA